MTWVADNTSTTTTTASKQSLAAPTSNKTFCLKIDLTNMALGDELWVIEEIKTLTGDSVLGSRTWIFKNAQDSSEVIFETDPVASEYGVTYSIWEKAGSHRAYKWEQLSI